MLFQHELIGKSAREGERKKRERKREIEREGEGKSAAKKERGGAGEGERKRAREREGGKGGRGWWSGGRRLLPLSLSSSRWFSLFHRSLVSRFYYRNHPNLLTVQLGTSRIIQFGTVPSFLDLTIEL